MSTVSIFLDESGYTGPNLLDSSQPIFTIATLKATEDECKEMKNRYFSKINAVELKHSNIIGRPRQENMVINFLKDLFSDPNRARVFFAHKKYVVLLKIVDFVVENAFNEMGIDLYSKGFNIAMPNMLWQVVPVFGNEPYFNEILTRFHKFTQAKDAETLKAFSEIINPQPDKSDFARPDLLEHALKPVCDSLDFLYDEIYDYFPAESNLMDITITGAYSLLHLWRKVFTDDIHLYHDDSSNMKEIKHIWDAIVGKDAPDKSFGEGEKAVSFPFNVERTYVESSKNWAGLQLADILAGAVTYYLNWVANGKNQDDEYCVKLDAVLKDKLPLNCWNIWPGPEVTPDEIKVDHEHVQDSIDYLSDVIKEAKKKK